MIKLARLTLIALALPLAQAVFAQGAPVVRIGAPLNRAMEEFSDILSVRELKDGRVLIADRKDARIVALDMRTGAVTEVGRKGQGPNEFLSVTQVWPIGGDSSVMIILRARWLLFDGARIVATLSGDAPAVAAAKSVIRGTNTLGDVFSASALGVGGAYGDSTPLLRISRVTGKVDTVTKLKGVAVKRVNEPGNSEGPGYFQTSVPALQVTEQAIPFPDGSVAVIRLDPYRVDWRAPNGVWTRGAPISVAKIPMTEVEKRGFMERLAKNSGKPAEATSTIADWPESVPPFIMPVQLFAAPDGRAIIGRLVSSKYPKPRYDVVNRSGKLESELELAEGQKIVGFGTGMTVYVSTVDELGIQRLTKHRWPTVGQR